MIRKLLNIALFVLAVAGLAVSLAFSARESERTPCKEINVLVDHSQGNFFVTDQDVRSMVFSKGDSLIGRSLSSIPVAMYERHISAHPSVKQAEVFKQHNGTFSVKVYQREPVIRIFNSSGESFYLDSEGTIMPISSNYTARVPVATGNIFTRSFHYNGTDVRSLPDSVKETMVLDDLHRLASYLREHPFWNSQIQQIIVEQNEELTLVPTVGDHHILLGTLHDLEPKLRKLELFYRKGLNRIGWEHYSHINLKYRKQVICTKKNS